jgi:hypothetical protein
MLLARVCALGDRATGFGIMNLLTRRSFALASVVVLALSAAACGDKEPEQRKTFIEFLQVRILERPGVRVPKLTDEEASKFGPYAGHFNVMRGFTDNPEMTGLAKQMQQVTQRVSLNSVQELVDNRGALRSVKDDLGKLTVAMNKALADTLKERDGLKQPDDLKVVYDKAFEKNVLGPARSFNETVPMVVDIAEAGIKLADYVEANRSKVTMQGKTVSGKDAKTQRELDNLVKNLAATAPKFQDAQRRLRIVLQGS